MTSLFAHDAAEDNHASYSHHPVEDIEPEEKGQVDAAVIAVADRIALFFSPPKKRGIHWDCFLLVTGAGFRDGKSAAAVARAWGVTKQAVSKKCQQIREALELPQANFMRRPSTRKTFRNRNPRFHLLKIKP